MKTAPILLLLAVGTARADLYVTNFTAINGTVEATGVWRNETAGTDLAISVSLSQSGGKIRPADGSSTQSILEPDGGAIYNLWQDVPSFPPFTPGINVFEPNFVGDYINIETDEGNTTTVTLDFGASVTNPVISFTDVEYRTTITFPSALTKLASTSNLEISGSSLSSDGTTAAGDPPAPNGIFEDEAAGSVQLTGTFETIVFTVAVAIGDGTVGTNDRTGYVVSAMTEPQPIAAGDSPALGISENGGQIMLMWQAGDFDSIEMSGVGISGWMPIPGLNPTAVGSWSDNISNLGDQRFFRGVYSP